MAARVERELPVGVFGDRRRAPRVPVSLRCQAVTDDDFFLLGEEIGDLSHSGLLLRADGVPADVGEEVLVSFQPPRSTLWIDARARIVRLLTGTERGAPGFGLRLEGLSAFEKEILRAAVVREAEPSSKRKRAPRRRPPARGRYLDPDAVAVRPLLRISEEAPSAPFVEDRTDKRRIEPRIPRAAFRDDEGVVVVRPLGWNIAPRSLWKTEAPLPPPSSVVIARPRPPARPKRNPALQFVEPRPHVVIARMPPAKPVVDPPPLLDRTLPPVAMTKTLAVLGAPPSVVVVRSIATGTPPPPPEPPRDAQPTRVVVVGRAMVETCVSDWSCAAD